MHKIMPFFAVLTLFGQVFLGGSEIFAAESEIEAKSEAVAPSRSAREILHRLADGVEKFTLSNGFRVLLFRRAQAPVFSGQVWVKVGGVNEVPGITGVSHMLEHMAFKGTKIIGTKDFEKEKILLERYEEAISEYEKNDSKEVREKRERIHKELEKLWVTSEFSRIYQNRGAVGLNAGTSKDYTFYMVSLPTMEFELWCWMESERLLNPVFRQFYKEREVVREERRTRVDDNPGGRMYEALLSTAFWSHPNRLPVIGWPSDIAALRTSHIETLYRTYYQPENMVITLVGDLESAKIRPMLEKYFGRISASGIDIPRVTTEEPKQSGERTVRVEFDAEPQLAAAFHKPVYPNADDLYFSVMHSLLSEGRSSLLHRELVLEKKLATTVYTSEAPGELFPSVFYVGALPQHGVSNQQLLLEIQKILDRLKKEKVSESALIAAKKRVRASLLGVLTSNYGLARTLGRTELLWDNWEVIFEMYDLILKTSAEDIMRLANTYFTLSNRTVVVLEKPAKPSS